MLPRAYDADNASRLLDDVLNGVRIGRAPAEATVISPNWPSALQFRHKVDEIVANDLALGRLDGPYITPPFTHFICSPLGAFLKRDGVKIRLIHDLSYPHGRSVNSLISPEDFSLQYASVDDAVAACRRLGEPVLSNIDLKDAYKFVGVAQADWHLLGFRWDLPGQGGDRFYFSRVLSFGLRSAPALFDSLASALEKFMLLQGVRSTIIRYVDDFLIVSDSHRDAVSDLATVTRVAGDAGFLIQEDKVAGPARSLQFLGVIIDLDRGELRISEDRVLETKTILAEWVGRRSGSKRKLLSLVGKLAFAARVVRSGRAFLGRLIALAKSVGPLHHHVRLTPEARKDIDWWIACIDRHNGVTTIEVDWSSPDVLHVYTDASGSGCGAVLGHEWFAIEYGGPDAFPLDFSINWRELHVAVKAVVTWAPRLSGHKVVFHIDNAAAGCIISKLYSPNQDLMELLRHWCLTVEAHSITTQVRYIATQDNVLADLLSRGDLDRFSHLHTPDSTRVTPASFPFYEKLV